MMKTSRVRRLAFACTVASAFALLANTTALLAQTVRGTVRDSTTNQPIAAAVVMLIDSSGLVLSRNISNERGQYGIALTAAAKTVRVIRIGFRPTEVPLPSNPDGLSSLDVAMTRVSTMLAAVRVLGNSNCPRRADDANALGLWEQARSGLLGTVVARESNPANMDRLLFERRFEGGSDRIARFAVSLRAGDRADRSFNASFSARVFVDSGFALDSSGVQLLFGPDADVLLDESFANAYCFRLAPRSRARPTQVGLAFAPARRKDGRVDIDGTLWVDTAARAITDVEFNYIGLPRPTDKYRPGGVVSFRQLSNGIVVIDRWQLRGVLAADEDSVSSGASGARKDASAIEFGGELAHATWLDGLNWNASLGALRVHAIAASGQPASGAIVALRDTHYTGSADASGDVVITDLLPGPYWLQINDPRLAAIGISIPTAVTFVAVRDSTARPTLKVPTAEEFILGRCNEFLRRTVGNLNLLVGRVITANESPVIGALVTYAAKTNTGAWQPLDDKFTTGADGVFQSCMRGLPLGADVRISVHRTQMDVVDTTVTLGVHLTVIPIRVP